MKSKLGDWYPELSEYINSEEGQIVSKMIGRKYIQSSAKIFPLRKDIFKAFSLTQLGDVKVVILGQDPYHNEINNSPVANGLSFSYKATSPTDSYMPPSLRNILKEVGRDLYPDDLGEQLKCQGERSLEQWATQGVLLLNTALTVQQKHANSHSSLWEEFTNQVFKALRTKEGIVYMLWGKFAQGFKEKINVDRNLVLETSHPSPFSVTRGFEGCKHFTKANFYLESIGKEPINWKIW